MAKKDKKNIADFQQALQQNIKGVLNEDTSSSDSPIQIDINEKTWKKFSSLATKQNTDPQKLLEVALEHFVRMEDIWFPKK